MKVIPSDVRKIVCSLVLARRQQNAPYSVSFLRSCRLRNDPQIYRLVLEHGDFGIHNMTIDMTANGPKVTSLFDWETGHIIPALLSDTEVAVVRDLRADGQGNIQVLRLLEDDTAEDIARFEMWAKTYVDVSHSFTALGHLNYFSIAGAFQVRSRV